MHITVTKKGKEEKGGEERGRVELSRWITLWFAPDRILRPIWRSQKGMGGGKGRSGRRVVNVRRS